jgi:hypothetical protein
MNLHKPVMKPHREFIWRTGIEFDPCSGIVQELAHGHWNSMGGDAKVPFAGPEHPGRSPYVTKDTATQVLDEFLSQDVAAAPECPRISSGVR